MRPKIRFPWRGEYVRLLWCCITPLRYCPSLPMGQKLPLLRWVLVGCLGPHQLPLSVAMSGFGDSALMNSCEIPRTLACQLNTNFRFLPLTWLPTSSLHGGYTGAPNKESPRRDLVVGMTIRVGQGQSHLSADVPGISTALGQRGRLQLKGRLCQQPAVDFTAGSPSRRRRRNSSNGCFTKSGTAPTRSTKVGDKRDASHARPPPTNGQDPPPRKDPRQSRGHVPRRCRSKGKRHFIKLPASDREPEYGGPTSRPRPWRSRQPGSRPPNL
jgi:hypothetical protein